MLASILQVVPSHPTPHSVALELCYRVPCQVVVLVLSRCVAPCAQTCSEGIQNPRNLKAVVLPPCQTLPRYQTPESSKQALVHAYGPYTDCIHPTQIPQAVKLRMAHATSCRAGVVQLRPMSSPYIHIPTLLCFHIHVLNGWNCVPGFAGYI